MFSVPVLVFNVPVVVDKKYLPPICINGCSLSQNVHWCLLVNDTLEASTQEKPNQLTSLKLDKMSL